MIMIIVIRIIIIIIIMMIIIIIRRATKPRAVLEMVPIHFVPRIVFPLFNEEID